ncbi:dephospho-CoA kinase [Mycoplasmoides genitalium]
MLIAIVGKPGVGKTSLLQYLKDNYHFSVFYADSFIHEQYQKNNPGYQLIMDHFGKEFVNQTEVDRKKLANYVFSDDKLIEKLSLVTKPLLIAWIKSLKTQFQKKLALIEIAVMLNYWNEYRSLFDYVIKLERDDQPVNLALQQRNSHKKVKDLIKEPNCKIDKIFNNDSIATAALKLIKLLETFLERNKCRCDCCHIQ